MPFCAAKAAVYPRTSDFPEPVADFHAALSGVTDFGRGLDSANRIAGHALNVFYADGTATKVFAPQENVFMQR